MLGLDSPPVLPHAEPGSDRAHPKRYPILSLVIAVFLSIAILLALWFSNHIHFAQMQEAWATADHEAIVLILVLSCLFHVFVGTHKLYYVLRTLGASISLSETLKLRLGAGPIRFLLPFSLGEIVQLVYLSSREHLSLAKASGFTLFDKSVNFLGSMFWLAFALSLIVFDSGSLARWQHSQESLKKQLIVLLGFILACCVALFFSPLHRFVIRNSLRLPTRIASFVQAAFSPLLEVNPGRKALLVAYGILFQIRPLAVFAGLLYAFRIQLPFARILAYGNLVLLAGAIPGPISGIGVRESAVVELLKYEGHSPALLLNIGLLMTLLVNVIPMLIGIPLTPWLVQRIRFRKILP